MMWLLTNAAALALYWWLPRLWVRLDVAAIQKDGAKDSLHDTFHRQRALWRAGMMLAIALLGALPLLSQGGVKGYILNAAGLFNLGAAWFFYDFNPRLSVARGLPKYYVSSDSRAARFPDRYIWSKTVKACPPPKPEAANLDWLLCRKQCAANMLQRLLRTVLIGGVVVYGVVVYLATVVGN